MKQEGYCRFLNTDSNGTLEEHNCYCKIWDKEKEGEKDAVRLVRDCRTSSKTRSLKPRQRPQEKNKRVYPRFYSRKRNDIVDNRPDNPNIS